MPSIADVIQQAIVTASGLAADHVRWSAQDSNQATFPYATLTLGGLSSPGQDGLVSSTDLNQPAGQEIKLQVVGFRETTLAVEVYTADSTFTGSDALSIAERIRTSLLLPSIRSTLTAVGVTPFDSGAAQWLPSIIAVGFRGRAVLELRVRIPAQNIFERTGYIETVDGKVTTSGGAIAGSHDTTFVAP